MIINNQNEIFTKLSVLNIRNDKDEITMSIWSDGLVYIADPTYAAFTMIDYISKDASGAIEITYNSAIRINLNDDAKKSIEWINKNYLQPYNWDQFVKEFERIYALRAFL